MWPCQIHLRYFAHCMHTPRGQLGAFACLYRDLCLCMGTPRPAWLARALILESGSYVLGLLGRYLATAFLSFEVTYSCLFLGLRCSTQGIS